VSEQATSPSGLIKIRVCTSSAHKRIYETKHASAVYLALDLSCIGTSVPVEWKLNVLQLHPPRSVLAGDRYEVRADVASDGL
jgi:hypothetical protein